MTGYPESSFDCALTAPKALIEEEGTEIFASNQVIGEAYFAIQNRYGTSKVETRPGLLDVLQSRLGAPLNGGSVIAALEASGGAWLIDQLIANEYSRAGHSVLTLDKRMAALPSARSLSETSGVKPPALREGRFPFDTFHLSWRDAK